MKVEIEVIKVTIITGTGTDKIILHTTMPDGCFPYDPHESYIELQAARNQGHNYVSTHWPELINLIQVIVRG